MSDISVTGLSSSDPIPGVYPEIVFGLGPASNGQTVYSALIIGNKLSAGSASAATIYGPDTTVPMNTADDAVSLFGDGAEVTRMVRRFLARNKTTPLYVICSAESAGAQADGYITFTGSTASANGSVEVWIEDARFEIGIASGDAIATIATNVTAFLSGHTELAVNFTAIAGAVHVQAKQKGPRGNWLRMSARIIGTNVGITVTPTAVTALTGGTTADDVTAALAAIVAKRFYYIIPAQVDATNLGLIKTQIDTQAQPINNIRQRMVSGSSDTLANTITIATGLNHVRAEVIWSQDSDLAPGELAAVASACYSLEEQAFGDEATALNFDNYGFGAQNQNTWNVIAPRTGTVPTRASISSALMNGVTPVIVNKTFSAICHGITSHATTNSVQDFRARERHIVTVCDHYADDLQAQIVLQYPNKTLGDDPKDGDLLPTGQITPRVVKATVDKLTSDYGVNGLLAQVPVIKADTVVQRSSQSMNRIGIRVPLVIVSLFSQAAVRIEQNSKL